ncbi:MAG TPA: CHAD domain-containing protein [Burkholderiales bacterium]
MLATVAAPAKPFRLRVTPAELEPRKAAPAQLDAAMRPGAAFAAIAAAALFQLTANAPGVLISDNPEFIHQMRVALRRLRSAMQLFRTYLPQDFLVDGGADLQWLAQVLGQARDHDVLITQTLPRVLRAPSARRAGSDERAIIAALQAPHEAACAAARKALRSRRYRALLHELAETVRLLGECETPQVRGGDLRDFAARKLKAASRKLRVSPEELAALPSDPRHQFRIAAKRLRYTVEFFAPLFKNKPAQRYARHLADLQDALGALNDHAVAQSMLATLAIDPATLQAAQARLRDHDRSWLEQTVAAQARLLRAKPFWD